MNIGIVGAGIIGRLLAFTLVNKGHQISLYDENDDNGYASCSMAAAGMLAPIAELVKSKRVIYEMGMEALDEHWPKLLASFKRAIYFQRKGSYVVAHPNDHAELTHFISIINNKINTNDNQIIYQKLTNNELDAHEPSLTKFNEAYYFPDEGQIDNQSLMHALRNELIQKDIQWHANTRVIDINENVISTASNTTTYDLVFDCRGLGAAEEFHDLQAVRGELIWLHAPEVSIQHPVRFMHPRYGLYIVPRPDNIFLIGASEIYANDYSPISVRSMLELLTSAYYLNPAFAEARIIKTVAHCRPAFTDHLPKIICKPGCIAVNGLYRHGFLIAPTLVNEMIKWLENGSVSLDYPQLWEFI